MSGRVYLVGMPGSGKSTVGRVLAGRLDLPFVDLDRGIERAAGRSIEDIFATEGEEGFRDRETTALRTAAEGPVAVVACGGGVLLRRRNRELMRGTGTVVYLEGTLDVLEARLRPYAGRPLLRSDADLRELLARREAAYVEAAAIRVDADAEPEDVAEAIREALG